MGWLIWPFQRWKERKAWDREEVKRARERDPDHELARLTGTGLMELVQDKSMQGSGMANGGPIAERDQLRKRKGKSGDEI